jgi:hypothetical protein
MVTTAKKKFDPYTPIGDDVSFGAVLVQAAIALDLAGNYAAETKDANQLIGVAHGWLQLAERLVNPAGDGEPDGEPDELESEHPLGFVSPAVDAMIKEKRANGSNKSRR